ncbi:MAG TPA: hypothetical protein VFT74_06600 [Isosphaeraceae bacterium]|nr:hypothetical protein [Isosphaeraceae bacterium]
MKLRLFSYALLLAAFATGCDSGSSAPPVSDSMEEATVSGTVSVKGQATVGAEISFDPSNKLRKVGARTAKVDEKGLYTIKTLVGQNMVSVHSPAIDADQVLSANGKDVDVKPGQNNIPIEIP